MAHYQKEYREPDIVRLAEELQEKPEAEALHILQQLPSEVAGEVLEHMDDETSSKLIAHLNRPEAAEILEGMAPDAAVDIMEELPEAERAELFRRMGPPEAEVLQELIAYPPDSAGGMMSPDVVALLKDLTVEQAIATLRRKANEVETIYYTYVVDRGHRLVGVLSMRDLIMREAYTPIEEVLHRDVVTVTADTDSEEVARIFDRYNFLALPVVDREGHLLGIVTADDIIDVIREEATEDMHRLVGVGADEKALSPWKSSLRRRLPWLYINLLTASLAATVVGLFQGAIEKYAVLAVFMPVIAGMGGNSGSQTVIVLVRGMALGEMQAGEGGKVLLKEMLLGMLKGLAIGGVVALAAYFLSVLRWHVSPLLGLVVFLAMLFNLTFAGVAGALIPMGLRFMGADPALASQILLTALTDTAGFFFLLGLATLILPGL
ncbi:MAG: magnesium transporter [Candidatus Fraserbacteria bacterium RBG_16_55_9]|uniref:Magnesium transporter MgtE n=1 Tax=Fraserbacteria sp. (strain RBG_16_55_9) TaxID=1817864 RepID=A0A1F5US65_FRAXR|nr:MAG: magnesium transporter [Candidatus Fraserbacteria bacterium RBG_16_55_9]